METPPAGTHFMTHLEYMQSEASKNMDFHMENMDNLQRESNNTLTFLYVAISACFSAALKIFLDGKYAVLWITLSLLCLYLVVVAVCLLFGCLMARPVQAPANEPQNLKIHDGFTSEQIQNAELENLQKRIDFNCERVAATARRLNCVRGCICLSPVFFMAVLVVLLVLSELGCPS